VEYKQFGGQWQVQAELPAAQAWPYELSPIVDWQHLPVAGALYGQHELPHAPLNDQINKILSDINRVLRFHAFPQRIGYGFSTDELKQVTGIDSMWVLSKPKTEASIENLPTVDDITPSMSFVEKLMDDFFRQSRVHIPGKKSGARTAYEVRLDYMDMSSKNDVLRQQYGAGITAISQRMLMVAGRTWENAKVMPEWANPLPVDVIAEWSVVKGMLDAGILSKRGAAERMGVDFETEQRRQSEELESAADNLMLRGDALAARLFSGVGM